MGFFKKLFRKKEEKVEEIIDEKIEEKLDEKMDEKVYDKIEEKIDEKSEEKLEEEVLKEVLEEKVEEEVSEKIEEIEHVENEIEEEKTEEIEEENLEENKEKKTSIFASLKEKLFKSREGFFSKIKNFILNRTIIDDEMYEELEDILIQSDIGMNMTTKIVSDLESKVRAENIKDIDKIYPALKDIMEGYLIKENNEIILKDGELNVILIVGVNGVGKTTTIGKIASKYTKAGKKVVLGAADTFRAAAVEQLDEWAKRSNSIIVKGIEGGDPGSVVFESIKKAEEENADVLIIDTAGRLHNKGYLMQELSKIKNIINKKLGDKFYETILVIDGTTGQNGLNQAKEFNEVTDLTGFIITKLDGTAKGGIVFSISEELKKPIKFIGVGEQLEDLREFDSKEYINAMFQ